MHSIHLKTCAIALAAAVSMPAFSQGSSTGSTGSSATTAGVDTSVRRESERGFDWGWLGLLGLAGLMGLRRQPESSTRVDAMRPTPQR